MLIKQKSPTFKNKSTILTQFNDPEVLLSESDKAALFAEISSKKTSLVDSGIFLRSFPCRTNVNNIHVTCKLVKKFIIILDLPKGKGPNCIPVQAVKNCESELSGIIAGLFDICLKKSFSQIVRKCYLRSLY